MSFSTRLPATSGNRRSSGNRLSLKPSPSTEDLQPNESIGKRASGAPPIIRTSMSLPRRSTVRGDIAKNGRRGSALSQHLPSQDGPRSVNNPQNISRYASNSIGQNSARYPRLPSRSGLRGRGSGRPYPSRDDGTRSSHGSGTNTTPLTSSRWQKTSSASHTGDLPCSLDTTLSRSSPAGPQESQLLANSMKHSSTSVFPTPSPSPSLVATKLPLYPCRQPSRPDPSVDVAAHSLVNVINSSYNSSLSDAIQNPPYKRRKVDVATDDVSQSATPKGDQGSFKRRSSPPLVTPVPPIVTKPESPKLQNSVKRERSLTPPISHRPRPVTEGALRFVLPPKCRKSHPDYANNRKKWVAQEVKKLRELKLEITRVFTRDDGMVIDWKSSSPVISDTLLPAVPEDSAVRAIDVDTEQSTINKKARPTPVQSEEPTASVIDVDSPEPVPTAIPGSSHVPSPSEASALAVASASASAPKPISEPHIPPDRRSLSHPLPRQSPVRSPSSGRRNSPTGVKLADKKAKNDLRRTSTTPQNRVVISSAPPRSATPDIVDLTMELESDSDKQQRPLPQPHPASPEDASHDRQPGTGSLPDLTQRPKNVQQQPPPQSPSRVPLETSRRQVPIGASAVHLNTGSNEQTVSTSPHNTSVLEGLKSSNVEQLPVIDAALACEAPSKEEIDDMQAAALRFLQSYTLTFESDRAGLASAYSRDATFSIQIYDPCSPTCSSKPCKIKQGRLDIMAELLSLPDDERLYADIAGMSKVDYDFVHLGQFVGALLMCYATQTINVDGPRRGKWLCDQRFVLKRKEWDEEDRSTEGLWPLVAVSHQMAIRHIPL